MKLHTYIPVYSLTLLLSAALLFSVQPMFSKMVLPLLGGTPQVWNTAMLFFQIMLLGGYAYAHGTTKFLGIRAQAILHLILLCIFTIALPIAIPDGWQPPVDKDPTLWQLSLMSITIGGPFFVLAGSAPMLQRWFAATNHKDADNPYFLYGASNLGSMTALLSYPFIIEPLLNLPEQSGIWTGGYIGLIALTLIATILVWKHGDKKSIQNKIPTTDSDPITWSRRLLWILLAFIPSSLMLGVTTYITTDIAAVPLLWIIPLALYVGTFIIAFARKPLVPLNLVTFVQGILIIAFILVIIALHPPPAVLIALHITLFFFCTLACHMELATSRPTARHLTEFYLLMSFGGALGGMFNALFAPNFLIVPLEYGMALAAACFMRFASRPNQGKLQYSIKDIAIALIAMAATTIILNVEENKNIAVIMVIIIIICLNFLLDKRWLFAITVGFILLLYPPGYSLGGLKYKALVHQDRSFFGLIRILDIHSNQRVLLHGITNHGTQSLDEEYRLTPLSYYGPGSPLQDAFTVLNDRKAGPQNVAIVGLGIGVTACYTKKERHFDYYEIDPDVVRIAENPEYFTFLSDCGSPYKVILGDGRLTLKNAPDNHYDLIVLDAFSSDNIPAHLLTLEATQLYLQKLNPDGALVVHISNHFLDLEPVLTQTSKKIGIQGYARVVNAQFVPGTDIATYPSHYFMISKNPALVNQFKDLGWSKARSREGVKLWTDQFSNIISVFGNKIGQARYDELPPIEEREREQEEKQ